MKKISCEACGSHELSKEGNYYVCDYCGTKYWAEEEATVQANSSSQASSTKKATDRSGKNIHDNPVSTSQSFKKENSSKKSGAGKIPKTILLLFCITYFPVGFSMLSNGNFGEGLGGIWMGAIFTNLSYTYLTGKKRFFTAHLKTWQIWILFFVVFTVLVSIF